MNQKKTFLVTSFERLNYPTGSKLIFTDEYLFNLHKEQDKSHYNCSYVNSFNYVNKVTHGNKEAVKKKLTSYRKKITYFLNFYHKKKYPEKYWGLIIDEFLLRLIESIVIEIKLLQNIKKNTPYLGNRVVKFPYFDNSNDNRNFILCSNDFVKILRNTILKELGFKNIHLNYKNTKKSKVKANKKKKSVFFLSQLIRVYIYFFKPVIISEGYIGLKNSIFFYIRSFGRILNVPQKFLFNEFYISSPVNQNFRQNIKVPEKDLVDKVFNKIIRNFLPSSFLEDFSSIKRQVSYLSEKITTIGTGNLHICNDHFSILAAEILNKGGKLLVFQHGGLYTKTNNLLREYADQKYATKGYYFDNKKGLGQHFFNMQKISMDEIKKRNSILILENKVFSFRHSETTIENYYSENFFSFFSNLEEMNKKKVLYKSFPEKYSLILNKLWKLKFRKKIKFSPIFSNATNENYYNAKLVIIDSVSTSLYELLYLRMPFIMILNPNNSLFLKTSFRRKLIKLKKINLLFEDPKKASHFVNSLIKDNQLEKWWNKTSKTKIFLNLKNYLLIERKNYLTMIVKDIINLK